MMFVLFLDFPCGDCTGNVQNIWNYEKKEKGEENNRKLPKANPPQKINLKPAYLAVRDWMSNLAVETTKTPQHLPV